MREEGLADGATRSGNGCPKAGGDRRPPGYAQDLSSGAELRHSLCSREAELNNRVIAKGTTFENAVSTVTGIRNRVSRSGVSKTFRLEGGPRSRRRPPTWRRRRRSQAWRWPPTRRASDRARVAGSASLGDRARGEGRHLSNPRLPNLECMVELHSTYGRKVESGGPEHQESGRAPTRRETVKVDRREHDNGRDDCPS